MKKKKRLGANQYEDGFIQFNGYFNFWKQRLLNMAYSAVAWKGLPSTPSVNLSEKFLCDNGQIVIFRDEIMGLLALPCIGSHSLTALGYPSEYRAIGLNGSSWSGLRDGENCVVVFNNPMGLSDTYVAVLYAKRLARLCVTWDINLEAQKTPLAMFADEDDRLNATNISAQYMGGARLIFGKKRLAEFLPQVVKTDAPFLINGLQEQISLVWNEWLNYLGVPGSVVQKKERLLRDEVMQQMGGALASRTPRMVCRKASAERASEMFGEEIEPYYTVDYTPPPHYAEWGQERQVDEIGEMDIDIE